MAQGYRELTEKEKQTLRLILQGYDAKSLARHLEISVHTVNERLRRARRKMAVSSSREAARRLLDAEGQRDNFLGHKQIGDAGAASAVGEDGSSRHDRARPSRVLIIGGTVLMSLILAIVALSVAQLSTSTGAPPQNRSEAAAQAEIEQSARQWLLLVDSGRWDESWQGTGQAFRELNTSAEWASISQEVRVPLGSVRSRSASGGEFIPAPPKGYYLIRFQTSFSNRPDITETLTLMREDGEWRVVAYIIS